MRALLKADQIATRRGDITRTETIMMKKETLNTLILRHGDRMLRQLAGPTLLIWRRRPETVPGWFAARGSLSGVETHAYGTALSAADVWPGSVVARQRPAAGGNPGSSASLSGAGISASGAAG